MAKDSGHRTDRAADAKESSLLSLRAPVIFVALVVGFNLVQWFLLKPWHIELIQLGTAQTTAALIKAGGIPVALQGTLLQIPGATWEIAPECTAISAMIVFASMVLATPARWSSRLAGIAIGIPLLFLLNVLRLVVLAWITRLWPALAAWAHDYLWQVVFLLIVVLLWMAWFRWSAPDEKHSTVSR